MEAFFVLYALTISIELVLSLVMAIFLFLILAPTGSRNERQPETPQHPRPLARTELPADKEQLVDFADVEAECTPPLRAQVAPGMKRIAER